MNKSVTLPLGGRFAFWDDRTRYRKVYHVAGGRAGASDSNPGTAARPFKTIGRAAAVLRPGEKAVVHEGTYRECVRPARGGESATRMIAYEAAPGERVVVKGSEGWTPRFVPSAGWFRQSRPQDAHIWMADLPAEWFAGYNPFQVNNVPMEYTTFVKNWSPEETRHFQLRRGMVFVDGQPLKQVFRIDELRSTDGAFWVEEPGRRVHVRLWKDADPNGAFIEVTTREQVFAPVERGLGFVRVSGFCFEHAADGLPVPQRACVSTSRGHRWIIEDNTVRWANACGLDLGAQHWSMADYQPCGHHIVRQNTVTDCGICGIAGVKNVDGSLIEDNVIERIGGHDVERLYENAGMKLHVANGVLIRRNVFRHIHHACGLWLDYLNRNCLVTGNVFADISSFVGGIYMEVSHEPNAIERNLVWDIRGEPWDKTNPHAEVSGGHGIKLDSCEHVMVAHNLVGKLADGYALYLSLDQSQREVGGRTGLCRDIRALNNIIVRSPKRILLGRADSNVSDGNLFDDPADRLSFTVTHPEPKAQQNLKGWQEFFGFDRRGAQAKVECAFDPERVELTFRVESAAPVWRPVKARRGGRALPPGPFDARTWTRLKKHEPTRIRFECGRHAPNSRGARG